MDERRKRRKREEEEEEEDLCGKRVKVEAFGKEMVLCLRERAFEDEVNNI